MKLLFFPSDLGGGLGHINRCLALAEEARRRGHQSVFVLHNPKHLDRVRRRFPAHLCRSRRPLASITSILGAALTRPRRAPRPLFIEFNGLDYQVPRDGLLRPADVERRLARYLRLVRSIGPDLLVGDTNLLVWILSRRTDLPAIQLVRAASHPDTARIIWRRDGQEELEPPRTAALFNPLLERWGLDPIQRAEDLLRGDRYLVPSIPEIEPIPPDERTVHLGAVIDTAKEEPPPPWLGELPRSQPLVYLTMGGGAGPVGSHEFLRTVVDAVAGKPFQMVVSTGGTLPGQGPRDLPDNLHILPWVPGRQLIARARLVISHGGYGTMMESLSAGRPMITVPFQSEQEGNGRRLEQLGCGLVLRLSRDGGKTVSRRWPQGTYTYRVQETYDLPDGAFAAGLDRVLTDPAFGERAEQLGEKIRSRSGPRRALEILETLAR